MYFTGVSLFRAKHKKSVHKQDDDYDSDNEDYFINEDYNENIDIDVDIKVIDISPKCFN